MSTLLLDEVALHQQLHQAKLITDLQVERQEMVNMLIKQRSYSKLKLNRLSQKFTKQLILLNDESAKIKAKAIETRLLAEENGILLDQQKSALQKQLKKLDIEFNNLKNKLDKEVIIFN